MAASMATDYWLAAIPLDVDPDRHPHPWTSACGWRPDPWTSMPFTRNTVNVTVELSSFGRPKEEKSKPHLRPLREAATTTWSKHSLGHSQPSQPGSQRGQPATHHRQRETNDVREPPEDTHSRHGDTAAMKRIVHSCNFDGTGSACSPLAAAGVDSAEKWSVTSVLVTPCSAAIAGAAGRVTAGGGAGVEVTGAGRWTSAWLVDIAGGTA
ncbi:hypothetical protein Taro_035186 [Colocasia esculenta]|uniref:Uncharacterized protein n=1 Tax=Colocasia esculenta TaxID=4460 RepID=A0A843W515_COLES|nr:hypothetical protein [Colocasia esculenta]